VLATGECWPPDAPSVELMAAAVPVLDVNAIYSVYMAGLANETIERDWEGPPIKVFTVKHWGPPIQRALVRHVLTLVAEARHRAGRSARVPAPLVCN